MVEIKMQEEEATPETPSEETEESKEASE